MPMPMIPGDGYGASQNPIANPKKGKKPGDPGYGASQHPVAPDPLPPTPYRPVSPVSSIPFGPAVPTYRPVSPTSPVSLGPPAPGNLGGGSGNSGGSVGNSNATLDKLYADLKASLTQTGIDNNALVDKSIGAIKGNYTQSQLDAYKTYMNNRDDLSGRALNLGVNLDESTMGKTWDGNMRRLTEMSDSNLNSDLSYMEKMRQIKAAALEAILSGVEQDKLSRLAAMRSGGGGSSRGGGGSGSSSGSATETQTVNNVGDYELYQQLQKTNPAAAQQFYNHYWGNAGNANNAVGSLLQDKIKATKGSFWNFPKKIIATASYNPAIQAMLALTGQWGNPKISQKVTYKGK